MTVAVAQLEDVQKPPLAGIRPRPSSMIGAGTTRRRRLASLRRTIPKSRWRTTISIKEQVCLRRFAGFWPLF
jgi:hypothetical protein